MSMDTGTSRIRAVLLVLTALIALSLVGCGGSGDDAPVIAKISDTGQTLTPEDLSAAGFKASKTYSTDGLPGATAAVFGFWRQSGRDPLDFEIRFYPTHASAVQDGTGLAEEGTGDDAVLDEDSATFKEGVQDRRTIIGAGAGGGARSGIGPKYADFVIYNNVVILCPGGQVEQSHERCAALIAALEMQ